MNPSESIPLMMLPSVALFCFCVIEPTGDV